MKRDIQVPTIQECLAGIRKYRQYTQYCTILSIKTVITHQLYVNNVSEAGSEAVRPQEAAVMEAYRQTDQTASEEKMTKQADRLHRADGTVSVYK